MKRLLARSNVKKQLSDHFGLSIRKIQSSLDVGKERKKYGRFYFEESVFDKYMQRQLAGLNEALRESGRTGTLRESGRTGTLRESGRTGVSY